jgi:hypothetical protein
LESLDGGRRTNAKRGDKAKRDVCDFWRYYENSADKDRDGAVNGTAKNSGMGHGANRALMAGKLGVVTVNVDCLDDADECDKKDTQQRQSGNSCLFARVTRENQTKRPTALIPGIPPASGTMRPIGVKLPLPKG